MITPQDLLLVGLLAFLEALLSIDNALVLALLARHLPRPQQRKALLYGLAGSVLFRLLSLLLISSLLKLNWVKFVGGGYLILISLRHLLWKPKNLADQSGRKRNFWMTVLLIELMDVAFAVDSILAAVALTPKFWLVFAGGMIGVILMRFAATGFLGILRHFPNFEATAYLMILVIGGKLILEGLRIPDLRFDSSSHPAFWGFWGILLLCVLYGFKPKSRSAAG